MKKPFLITLRGCDNTEVRMDLSEEEFDLLSKLSEKSYAEAGNGNGCVPILDVEVDWRNYHLHS